MVFFSYKIKPDKACFQHNLAYDKSKYLAKRTQSDKDFRHKGFNITVDPKYDNYQRWLASMVSKVFVKNLVEVELSLCLQINMLPK